MAVWPPSLTQQQWDFDIGDAWGCSAAREIQGSQEIPPYPTLRVSRRPFPQTSGQKEIVSLRDFTA